MKNKIVIYTCITGGYDTFNFPLKKKEPEIDYIVFTDDANFSCDGWEIHRIPEELFGLSKVKQARMVKICSHRYLPEYDVSIWFDAAIRPVKQISLFLKKYDLNKHSIYMYKHWIRDCLYDEMEEVVKSGFDTGNICRPQINRYMKEGFPRHFGLAATGLILRKHNDEKCKLLMNKWASEMLSGSHRDQLSFTYCVWKLGIDIGWMNTDAFSEKNNDFSYFKKMNFNNYHLKNQNFKEFDDQIDFKQKDNIDMIIQKYEQKCREKSDINEHLPTLFKYASKCENVIEFGVRNVTSSWAFANAHPKQLICVDIKEFPEVKEFLKICHDENQPVEFVLGDTLKIDIPETDMLFIDTLHNYDQLKQELARHHSKVRKYILFHDIVSFGHKDETNPNGKGLVPAINEFVDEHENEWKWKEIFTNNNGLGVIERIGWNSP